jgi:hypothetical protein
MHRTVCISLLALAFLAEASFAESVPASPKPSPGLLRGTIAGFDGHQLTIKTPSGDTVSGMVSEKSRLCAVEARTFAQLKSTDFVGVTAVEGRRGHLRAEEIHVIPIAGVGEGQYPWDHHPDNAPVAGSSTGSMTNGTVETTGAARTGSMTNGTIGEAGGSHLTLSFHGSQVVDGKCVGHAAPGGSGCTGKAVVDVTSSTYIAALVLATPEDLKPGLAVVAGIGTTPDGRTFVGSATVEKNGVKPQF